MKDDELDSHASFIFDGIEKGLPDDTFILEVVLRIGAPFEILLGTGGTRTLIRARLDDGGDRQGHAELVVTQGQDQAIRWSEALDAFVDQVLEGAMADLRE